jgi:hypothetical protein
MCRVRGSAASVIPENLIRRGPRRRSDGLRWWSRPSRTRRLKETGRDEVRNRRRLIAAVQGPELCRRHPIDGDDDSLAGHCSPNRAARVIAEFADTELLHSESVARVDPSTVTHGRSIVSLGRVGRGRSQDRGRGRLGFTPPVHAMVVRTRLPDSCQAH